MHVDVSFFKCLGAGARGRGHGTLLLVDFRGKSLEHAMHPQGGGGFKGFAPAAGPFALWKLELWKSARLCGCKLPNLGMVLSEAIASCLIWELSAYYKGSLCGARMLEIVDLIRRLVLWL